MILYIAEFVYNNRNNTNPSHLSFEFYSCYYLRFFIEVKVNLYSKSRLANKKLKELKEINTIRWQNLFHAKQLQKKVHD